MLFDSSLEKYRARSGQLASNTGDRFGFFLVPGPCGTALKIIACEDDPPTSIFWEHVSVSCRTRTPNWTEMCYTKDLFWGPEEVVMQLHPAKSKYVNVHDYVLHLWKPTKETIPLPPKDTI